MVYKARDIACVVQEENTLHEVCDVRVSTNDTSSSLRVQTCSSALSREERCLVVSRVPEVTRPSRLPRDDVRVVGSRALRGRRCKVPSLTSLNLL